MWVSQSLTGISLQFTALPASEEKAIQVWWHFSLKFFIVDFKSLHGNWITENISYYNHYNWGVSLYNGIELMPVLKPLTYPQSWRCPYIDLVLSVIFLPWLSMPGNSPSAIQGWSSIAYLHKIGHRSKGYPNSTKKPNFLGMISPLELPNRCKTPCVSLTSTFHFNVCC